MSHYSLFLYTLLIFTLIAGSPGAEEHFSPLQIQPKELEKQLKEHIHFDSSSSAANSIGHILIDDRQNGINQSTWLYVKNALDYYKKTKPIFVILELNTPGGEVFAAQKISDALKDLDIQDEIPVVAFINNWAISAGAMLAYSCRFISIVKDASMGAAEPVYQGETGQLQTASEKVNSALRADFANRAGFFGRNPLIAEAMVDKDMILVLRHGKVVQLDSESLIRSGESDPDIVIAKKGKLLTLNAEQLIEYGVADMLLLPIKLQPITELEKEKGKWPASKTLLFQQPFFNEIPNAIIDTYRVDWRTRFFMFLSTPMVSSLLFLGLMVGFYIEISTPGFGVAGTVALTSLILIILSSFSVEAAPWLEVILLFAGMVIIAVDLFVLPTFGFLGFIGSLFFLAGLIGLMIPGLSSLNFEFDTKTFNAAGEYVLYRLAWFSGTFIVGAALIVLLSRYIVPRFSLFNRLVSIGEQEASKGYYAGENPAALPPIGSKGVVLATLRPAGKISIETQAYDAVSLGEFIEKGEPVVIVRIEGSKIVVTKS
jgi:membrane-bound ClpP family serine protease